MCRPYSLGEVKKTDSDNLKPPRGLPIVARQDPVRRLGAMARTTTAYPDRFRTTIKPGLRSLQIGAKAHALPTASGTELWLRTRAIGVTGLSRMPNSDPALVRDSSG